MKIPILPIIFGMITIIVAIIGTVIVVVTDQTPRPGGIHDGKAHFVEVGSNPERQDDEVHLYNVDSRESSLAFVWKTARLGKVPTNNDGQPLEERFQYLRPVFVKKSEILAAGYTLKE